MLERRIKELSFALEALSRVNAYDAANSRDSVQHLLTAALKEAEQELELRMTKPTTPASRTDDEIPF